MGKNKSAIAELYRDEAMLAVAKPAGSIVSPERWEEGVPTLLDEIEGDPAYAGVGRLYVVHRLDRDTSGVLILARSAEAHRALSLAFEERRTVKVYRALVAGEPSWEETTADMPLLPDGDREHRTIVDAGGGKPSRTRFRVLARFRRIALVEALPETGRTHQIRVHLAALGHPALCDPLYGDGKPFYLSSAKRGWKGDEFDERPLLDRTALHALSLEVPHPQGGRTMRFEAPYPRDMDAAITQLGKLNSRGRPTRGTAE